jgi:hypothetical protein
MRRTNAPSLLLLLPCASLLAACAGTDMNPVASYGQSNALSPSGYWEKEIDDTRYEVTATGTEATPKTRIEKIARARAAQIAVEKKLKYYKVASVQFGFICSKKHEVYKGGAMPPANRQRVLLDVVYAKEPVDASFLSAAESYEALSGELNNEVIPPEAKAAAEQEARGGCGQAT